MKVFNFQLRNWVGWLAGQCEAQWWGVTAFHLKPIFPRVTNVTLFHMWQFPICDIFPLVKKCDKLSIDLWIFQVLLNIVAAVDKGWFKVILISVFVPEGSLRHQNLPDDDDGKHKKLYLCQSSDKRFVQQLPVSTNDGKGGKVVSKAEVFSSNTLNFSCFIIYYHTFPKFWSKHLIAGFNSCAWGS